MEVKSIMLASVTIYLSLVKTGLSDALSNKALSENDTDTSTKVFMNPKSDLGNLEDSVIGTNSPKENLESQSKIGSDLQKEDLESKSIIREINGPASPSNVYRNSLSLLLSRFILDYIFYCDLIVFIDKEMESSEVLEELLRYPNFKQIVEVGSLESAEHQVFWKSPRCQGIIILLSNPDFLLEFGEKDSFSWDYGAKVIIVDQTKDTLESFLQTKKAKKTEHIIGIVQVREGHYDIYMNELFWGRRGLLRISSWRRDKLTKIEDLEPFPNKIRDLRGAVLNIVVFEWPPSITYHRDKEGNLLYRYGQDITLGKALAQAFNFTISYLEVSLAENFGFVLPNGSFFGMAGLLEKGIADLYAGNAWIANDDGRLSIMDHSFPYTMDHECILLLKDPPLPLWHSPGLPFQLITWIVVFAGMFLAGPVLYSFIRASNERESGYNDHHNLSTLSLYAFGAHFSHPMSYLPKHSSSKIFVAFLWIYSIILTTGYKSNLTAFLTITRVPKSIETIKELYESGMTVAGNLYYVTAMSSSVNPYIKGLSENSLVINGILELEKPVLAGEISVITSKIKLEMLALEYSSPTGKPLTRIIKECIGCYGVAIMYQKHSPLSKRFNNIVMGTQESGLAEKWSIDTLKHFHHLRRKDAKANDNTLEKPKGSGGAIPLGLDHLQGVFIVWSFGSLMSAVLFSSEIIASR